MPDLAKNGIQKSTSSANKHSSKRDSSKYHPTYSSPELQIHWSCFELRPGGELFDVPANNNLSPAVAKSFFSN
jgi:hypothetical protein